MKFLLTCFFSGVLTTPLYSFTLQKDSTLFQNKEIRIFRNTAFYTDQVLYDATSERNKLMADEPCAKLTRIIYTPLSMTGDVYAYEKAVIEEGSIECGSPASNAEIIVINVVTQKPASILDLADEASLLSALKNDAWVKKLAIPAEVMAACTSLNKLITAINEYSSDGSGNNFTPQQFAVSSYDAKTNKLAIRLIKKEYFGFNHYKFLQLGLWVTPNEDFAKLKTREGFYMGKFKGGILNP
jgi:hypothetical protein